MPAGQVDAMRPAATPVRDVRLGELPVTLERRADGSMLMRPTATLGPYPDRLTARLEHWAAETPERTFLAARDADGDWRRLSYAETLHRVRAVAQALLDRDLGPERPIAILSGNDIEHALLGLAAMYAGIPYAPVSPAYALLSTEFTKLRDIFGLLTPGLVLVADGPAFAAALDAVLPADAELVTAGAPPPGRAATAFADLLATPATATVDAAHARVGPDTVAKLLFTSGSTGRPKGVINTQRMLCANQVMIRTHLAFLQDEPPVVCDWLPWSHTFGGNHNVGLVLFNGGTLYIDEGRPLPGAIEATVRNLRDVAPTVYLNVPRGFEMLLPYLRDDADLRRRFFSRLRLMFYAGAGLGHHAWEALDALAVGTCGARIAMQTGLGATETAPLAMCCPRGVARSGAVGVPVPGFVLKLAPVADKLEARLKGPAVTPGYWRQPELTAAAFDDEGYYRMGDAVRFLDPDDPQKGFLFDGRIAEDFKLSTATWVSVGPLRTAFLARFAPYAQDVVFAGQDRDRICALVFPNLAACRDLHPDLAGLNDPAALLAHPTLGAAFRERLQALAADATGSATLVARLLLLEVPPSIDAHELTDKGTINQRAVLDNRADRVAELYAAPLSPRVITIEQGEAGGN